MLDLILTVGAIALILFVLRSLTKFYECRDEIKGWYLDKPMPEVPAFKTLGAVWRILSLPFVLFAGVYERFFDRLFDRFLSLPPELPPKNEKYFQARTKARQWRWEEEDRLYQHRTEEENFLKGR